MKSPSIAVLGFLATTVLALGCAVGGLGDAYTWERPCGTDAQREADSQACLSEAAGISDPSSGTGVEYAQDLFRECMEARGWQQLTSGTTLKCE